MNMDTGQIQSLRFADLVALLIALCFEVARRLEIPIPQAAASHCDTESGWEQVDPEVGPQQVHPAVGQQQGYGAVGQQQVHPAVGSGQQGHPAVGSGQQGHPAVGSGQQGHPAVDQQQPLPSFSCPYGCTIGGCGDFCTRLEPWHKHHRCRKHRKL